MKRSIVGFEQDDVADWMAILDCGHRQHVRHNPPLVSRPWVLTEEGRTSHLAEHLDCVRCERFELPAHFEPYRQSPVFTQDTVPAALQKNHTTRHGVWGKIHVLEGRLRYVVDGWGTDTVLTPDTPQGIVVPEVPHYVRAEGPVRFYVEFHADPAAKGQP
jgi:tellurite methyltransferase